MQSMGGGMVCGWSTECGDVTSRGEQGPDQEGSCKDLILQVQERHEQIYISERSFWML